jgi:hypothetical protein
LKEFKSFVRDTNICDQKQGEMVFLRYCINKELSFESFKFAIKEIGYRKDNSYEDVVKEIVQPIEEKNIKKNKEMQKKIVKRQENLNLKSAEKKQDEQLKEIVQDMCLMGKFMKKEIVKEKQNNPDKFIPIEDAINDKDNNEGLNIVNEIKNYIIFYKIKKNKD